MEQIVVSKEVGVALDKLPKDEWSKRFHLIGHCKSFSGNGIKMENTFIDDFAPLNTLDPLEFATCLINGYKTKA